MNKVCALVGFGPGLGQAYARTFAENGYDMALLSRSGGTMDPVEGATVKAFPCDAGDPDAMQSALDAVEADLGPIDTLIYNADIKRFGPVEDISVADFEQSWRVAVLGLFAAARHLAPGMIARGGGNIIVSGATASLRGAVWTTALAPSKASQRILSQSLAKQLGPRGVHVSYMIIDGVIDTHETRTHFKPGAPDEDFIKPGRIAETALMLARQDPSAWTFELDIRPFKETW